MIIGIACTLSLQQQQHELLTVKEIYDLQPNYPLPIFHIEDIIH